MSSILNLFSFPSLWRNVSWATPAKLQAIQASPLPNFHFQLGPLPSCRVRQSGRFACCAERPCSLCYHAPGAEQARTPPGCMQAGLADYIRGCTQYTGGEASRLNALLRDCNAPAPKCRPCCRQRERAPLPTCSRHVPAGVPCLPTQFPCGLPPAFFPGPAAQCIPPSPTCVTGSYAVDTPDGQGCLSCFDLNVAVGPKCYVEGTASCTKDKCNCLGDYSGARCNEFVRPP